MPVKRMFFSVGRSMFMVAKSFVFRITRREPKVLMTKRDEVLVPPSTTSFRRNCPRPRSNQLEFAFSKRYSWKKNLKVKDFSGNVKNVY